MSKTQRRINKKRTRERHVVEIKRERESDFIETCVSKGSQSFIRRTKKCCVKRSNDP